MQANEAGLIRHLRMLYDMESSVYQQKEFIKKLLAMNTPLPSPLPPDRGKPVFKWEKVLAIGLVSLFIAVALLFLSSQYWSNAISSLCLLAGLVCIYHSIAGKSENKRDVEQWEADNARRRTYAAAVTRKKYIDNEIQIASNKANDSIQLLNQMYTSNIIYPKYRNLPAISSFLDYFSSGRCTSLTGPYGAYNLYESEARMDGIITRLDNISSQLTQIQFNQRMLFFALKNCNETVSRLCRSVENSANHLSQIAGTQSKIEQNTATTAYYAKLLEKESAYRNRMQYDIDYR